MLVLVLRTPLSQYLLLCNNSIHYLSAFISWERGSGGGAELKSDLTLNLQDSDKSCTNSTNVAFEKWAGAAPQFRER